MPRIPKPSTASKRAHSSYEYSHGASHELGGSDPVLPSIIYHGSVSKTASQTITSQFTTYTDISSLTMDVTTTGGQLLVMMTGPYWRVQDSSAVNAVEASIRLMIDSAADDFDARHIYLAAQPLAITGDDLFLGSPINLQWLSDSIDAGLHEIKLQGTCHNGSSPELFITANTKMLVFELLPLRF